MKTILTITFCFVLTTTAYEISDIVSGRIESCRGCSLNRLPEVKKFILNDVPSYDRIDIKYISGAPPELVLLGAGDHELERLPLSNLDRQACNELLKTRGFEKSEKNTEF